jgi:hypothetical protein
MLKDSPRRTSRGSFPPIKLQPTTTVLLRKQLPRKGGGALSVVKTWRAGMMVPCTGRDFERSPSSHNFCLLAAGFRGLVVGCSSL